MKIRPAVDEFFHAEPNSSLSQFWEHAPKNSIFSKLRQRAGHGPTTEPKRRRRRRV